MITNINPTEKNSAMLQYRSNKHNSSIRHQQQPHLNISSFKSLPREFLGHVGRNPNLRTEYTQRNNIKR